MAYVKFNKLENNPSGKKLDDLNTIEQSETYSYYVEDISLLTSQPGYASIKKKMATFWGARTQVCVGYSSGEPPLPLDIIVLPCPPYYPPHTTREVDISDFPQPTDFP